MVRRHADHLHEYKHRLDFNGLEIEKAYFMTIDENADDKELDDLETAVIQQAEHDNTPYLVPLSHSQTIDTRQRKM